MVLHGYIFINNPWGYTGHQDYEGFTQGFLGVDTSRNHTLMFLLIPD